MFTPIMEQHWHIYFERTGGFSGILVKVEIDSDDLPSDERNNLQKMITKSEFFELGQSDVFPDTMPDSFQYKLIIESNEKKHTLNLNEQDIPDSLRSLLHYLVLKARNVR